MRPRQSTGRPGTPVIPTDWETAPAHVVQAAMCGTVQLRSPSVTQEWSDAEQQMVPTPAAAYYDGPARVQALTAQSRRVVTAEDGEIEADYLIVVTFDVDEVAEGHLVTVTAAADAALVDKVLTVRSVEYGTERFSRDLFCTLTP